MWPPHQRKEKRQRVGWKRNVCPLVIIKWNGKEGTVQIRIEVLRMNRCLLSARHSSEQLSVRLAIKQRDTQQFALGKKSGIRNYSTIYLKKLRTIQAKH